MLGHPELGERILIVGSGSFAIEIARETLSRPDAGFRVIGFVDNDPALVGKSLINPKVIGLTSELASLVKREHVDRLGGGHGRPAWPVSDSGIAAAEFVRRCFD